MNLSLIEIGKKAKQAAYDLSGVNMNLVNIALVKIADELENETSDILEANQKDVVNASEKIDNVMIDRLTLNEDRVKDLSRNLRAVANIDSPLNKVDYSYQNLQGFRVNSIIVPIGVIAMIYEARPNVTTEAMSLALKSGNSIILRGSASTLNTNIKLIEIINKVGIEVGLPKNFVQLVESSCHEDVNELVKMNEYIDLVIPRGSERLIKNVVLNSTIPIIETGTGNNFAYVDNSADIDESIKVLVNAKAQRPTVCNALEKILIDKNVSDEFIEKLEVELKNGNVLIKAHENIIDRFDKVEVFNDDELSYEYLDYIIGIKQVNDIDEAISIINKYSSKHSNLILSTKLFDIEKFTSKIDSACVYVNTSTRFSDGVEFGLGSEVGISTQKIHARGPMGLKALTSTKNIIVGEYITR